MENAQHRQPGDGAYNGHKHICIVCHLILIMLSSHCQFDQSVKELTFMSLNNKPLHYWLGNYF